MHRKYKIVIWNANGLNQHLQEWKPFLVNHNGDIGSSSNQQTLYYNTQIQSISHETSLRGKSPWKSLLIILYSIKHHETEKYKAEWLQAISIL